MGRDVKQFQPVADLIEGVVQMIAAPIQKMRLKTTIVKFGMEMAIWQSKSRAVCFRSFSETIAVVGF
jgi:hypothetical protein